MYYNIIFKASSHYLVNIQRHQTTNLINKDSNSQHHFKIIAFLYNMKMLRKHSFVRNQKEATI